MAAEMVLWENLTNTLDSPEVALLLPREQLGRLQDLVSSSKGAVVAMDGRNHIHDSLIHGRLEKLSTLLHKADDLLDQILTFGQRTRLSRGEMEGNGRANVITRVTQEVNLFLSSSNQLIFPRVMAGRIETLSREIRNLVGQLQNDTYQPNQRQFLPIGPFRPDEQRVIGRKNDKKNIIRMLLQTPTDSKSNVSVICISGVAGVGKSALARDVYEDEKIKSHFDLRIWVPVSQITDEAEIVREIVESCTNRRASYSDTSRSAHYHNSQVSENDRNSFPDLLGCRSSGISTCLQNNNAPQKEIDIYKRRLRKEIKGKLYLLILDYVCLQQWHSLRELLDGGARGSQILVTTRLPAVADLVNGETRVVMAYKLRGLSKEDSWTLFRTLAELDESCKPEMKKTGFEIADICKHVPLTIKVAARFLQGRDMDEWLAFKEELRLIGGQEEDVMKHVLHLSFSDLPTHLRTCFGYCFLFPDDFTFNKRDLISLWIAHGFISPRDGQNQKPVREPRDDQNLEQVGDPRVGQSREELRVPRDDPSLEVVESPQDRRILEEVEIPRDGQSPEEVREPRDGQNPEQVGESQDGPSLEEVGEMYFMELSRRCLFEQVSTDNLRNILTCKIHHIVGSLASKLTAGVANIHMTDSWIEVPDRTFKHLSINCRGNLSLKFSSPLLECPSLRTLIFVKEPDCHIKVDTLVCNQLISKYRRLRVLDLHDLGLRELPDSIGEQIHLRYLDLSKNDGLVTLPKSFARLHNLQTLKLNSCPKLKNLSSDFGLLVKLKRFEVHETDSMTCMPLGLEKLTQLETLSRFVVGLGSYKQTASVGLSALSGLSKLRGRLTIELTGDWVTSFMTEAEGEWIKEMSKLSELTIRWAHVEVPSHIKAQEKLLKNLQPNSNLKILSIEGYKGGEFPGWARAERLSSSLPNLVIISIEGCQKCKFLPPFGELKHLTKLTLRHMTNVRYVEGPAHGSQEAVQGRPLFTSLEELTLHNFYKLEGWRKELASIQQAETRSFSKLSKLRIWNCPNLISLPSFPTVTDLKLRNVNQLLLDDCARKAARRKDDIGAMSLQIKGCPNLEGFESVSKGLGGLPSLKHLVIESCDALSSLADDVGKITSLERLEISNCKKLDLSHEAKTQIMVVHHLPKPLFMSPWKKLKLLRELTLREIPKMKILPEGLKHVRNLKTLCISACKSLESLPEWISSLTALQHLRIESCRALKSLPEGFKNVKSLMKVEITECPELMERCREYTGDDWPNIKHARVLLHKSWRYGYVS